jgi:hypothetical protein
MKGFEPVTLSWQGNSFTVPAEDQLRLIAGIEEALTGNSGDQAIAVLASPSGPSYSRLSAAYGAALRFAGAEVSDEEIYLSIMSDFAEHKADAASNVRGAVMALLHIIAPPIALALNAPEPSKKKKKTAKA